MLVSVVPNLARRSKPFHPCSHEDSSMDYLSWIRQHKDDQVFWICWGGLYLDSCLGNLANEVCDYSWLTEFSSEHLSEHPWTRPAWKLSGVHVFCHSYPVSFWDTPHFFYTLNFQGECPLSSKGELSSASHWKSKPRAHGGSPERPWFPTLQLWVPLASWNRP